MQDGTWHELRVAPPGLLLVGAQQVAPAALSAVGAAIAQHAAALFQDGMPVPKWSSTLVRFPAGFLPPDAEAHSKQQRAAAVAAAAGIASAARVRLRGRQPGSGQRRPKRACANPAAAGYVSSGSDEYAASHGSMSGDAYDSYVVSMQYEHVEPAATQSKFKAIDPVPGHRPGQP
jgi:hypothetical protein